MALCAYRALARCCGVQEKSDDNIKLEETSNVLLPTATMESGEDDNEQVGGPGGPGVGPRRGQVGALSGDGGEGRRG